ncbi:MyfA/PsaA family fimbrial adhesin [Yersinia enterocolitica]|uniref:MyfA/PsaA family fimbrial adhesin n=1 Tax=Yersinia enterocolitica TaxID=630 RepID=UPI0029C20BE2|nr:hypothetical protein [Yersinia enterocolitica]EKN6073740.1 hypothetical protein [Yersinia enterocolitica]HDL6700555.1 MyfA/PsaA family fimbrial adhesin [Yersinia enterocolitica]HDL7718649.1 MyfA/PsaA family fimbrial adhesin [Yersinia enterocolitica]HEI6895736.1 MyfA/PsaA family fimbrial adhesin [Yersinia enterocolitica]
MNMKKFVKKPLAIAVLMLTFGGVANAAPISDPTIASQDVSATKEIKQGGNLKVEFTASSDEIFSGRQAEDKTAFILKVSDSAEHSGWRLIPTGSSKDGNMYDDSGNTIDVDVEDWTWSTDHWYKEDGTNASLEGHVIIHRDDVVKAGTYHFTGRVEEYL